MSTANRDTVVEALRKALNRLQRYSFVLTDPPGVKRVSSRTGAWIEWQAVHELFDPVVVDALLAAEPGAVQTWPHDATDRVHELMGQLASKELECQRLREQLRSVGDPPADQLTFHLAGDAYDCGSELYRQMVFNSMQQAMSAIDRGADGRALSKAAQVRMCGNSVCPPLAAALVRANYVEQVAAERRAA